MNGTALTTMHVTYGYCCVSCEFFCFQNECFTNLFSSFNVSLTVYLDIILVNIQLDALFSMYLLFHLSTCFKHSMLIIRRVKLY